MKAYIASQRHWLVVERLPADGHDLNPVELIWGNLKASELANLCPDTIGEAAAAADAGLCRIGEDSYCAGLSCGTLACLCDWNVTVLCEAT